MEYIIQNDLEQITVTKDNTLFEIIDLEKEKINLEEQNSGRTTYRSDGWGEASWTYSSRSTRVTIVSACIGIIATILGVPKGTSIAISIGTTVFGMSLPNVYYKIGKRFRRSPSTQRYEMKKTTIFYSVSNYTGFLGDHSVISTVAR